MTAPAGVRKTVIFTGSYTECNDLLWNRRTRKGELATIADAGNGLHSVVVHEPPGTMRDATDLLREFSMVNLDGCHRETLEELQRKARRFLKGAR